MTAIVLFMACVGAIAGWWLSHQRLMAKPWLEEGAIGELPVERSSLPVAKIGLGVFFVVVGSLFTLVISAYSIRMDLADWQTVPIPKLLWFNTGVLVLSSVALELAKSAARRSDRDGVLTGLLAGGVSAIVFLIGQLLAWQQLRSAGYLLSGNPANSFFYLITGLHGLHIAGGLVALGRTIAKALGGAPMLRLRAGVELCAMYWHFLLLIWLIVLGLLTGQADEFLKICHQWLG
jgi:cytochrome c oxidase subunit III